VDLSTFTSLLYNAALLLVLVFVYDLLARRLRQRSLAFRLVTGVVLGCIAVATMVAALHLSSGLIFDTRSVVLSTGTLFYGTVPGLIAGLIAAAYRISLGGAGAVMGVLVIAESVAVGIVWRRWRRVAERDPSALELYLFGLTVHVIMLALTVTLPDPVATLRDIAVPVIVIYPLATVVLGLLMIDARRRLRTESAVRESEARYRSLFEYSPVAMWEEDDSALKDHLEELRRSGVEDVVVHVCQDESEYAACLGLIRIIDVNNSAVTLFDARDRSELLGRAEEVYGGKVSTGVHRYWAAMLAGERTATFEETNRTLRGADLELLETCTVVPGHERRYDRVFVADVDISERARMEGALRESEERFAVLFEQAPLGYQSLDEQGNLIVVNQRWLEMLDYERDEVMGRWFGDFLAPECAKVFRAGFSVLKERGSATFELEMLRKDGERRKVAIDGRVAHFPSSRMRETYCILTDVSERRRVEAEIQRLNEELERRVAERTSELGAANKELEAFAYSVSHDLRAPLRAIDGFSAIVAEDAHDVLDEESLGHLDRVRHAAQHMGELIDHLLALSRASRATVSPEDIDLTAQAQSVFAELQAAQPLRQVEFVAAPGQQAWADPVLLRAVLANLLGNAWKFTSKHETARIEVGSIDLASGERAFFVRDDGAGFDQTQADGLFRTFHRMHQASEFDGDGIGLATVQRLIERQGGRIWAEAAVEEGATFFFTLCPTRATSA
jgi:PAS domain S-box-containing protein